MNVRINENARQFGDKKVFCSFNGDNIGYEQRVLRSLRRIIRSVDVYSRKINSLFGITTPQMLCLYVINSEGPLTLSKLANEVNLCGSTVNGIVDRLVAKKLISRVRSRKDRRQVNIKILDEGVKVIESAPPLLQDKLAGSLARLDASDQGAIAMSLEKVVEMMEAESLENYKPCPNST